MSPLDARLADLPLWARDRLTRLEEAAEALLDALDDAARTAALDPFGPEPDPIPEADALREELAR